MRLFVSYASATGKEVQRLVRDLRALDHEVWYDEVLVGGTPWWAHILQRIREADGFVYAVSPESARSVACERELAYALALGVPVLPVAVRPADLSAHPAVIGALEVLSYSGRKRDEVAALSRAVAALPKRPALPDPLPPLPQPPPLAAPPKPSRTRPQRAVQASVPTPAALAPASPTPAATPMQWAAAASPGLGASLLALGLGPLPPVWLPDALVRWIGELGGGGILLALVVAALVLVLVSWHWIGRDPPSQPGLTALDAGPGALWMLALLYGLVVPLGSTGDEWPPMVWAAAGLHALGLALGLASRRSWWPASA